MFKPGNLYRHKSMRDVCFEVHKCFYVKEKKLYKLKIGWWNTGHCHDSWPMGIAQNIEIKEENLVNYQKVSTSFRVPIEEFKPVYY